MRIIRSLGDSALPLNNTAVALGMFDGVHRGHMEVLGKTLARARELGLTPCAFTFALSEPRPNFKRNALLTDSRMLARLLEEQGVEYVLAPSFQELRDYSPDAYVKEILGERMGAKVLCCGDNFTFAKGGRSGTQDLFRLGGEAGMEVHALPLLKLEGEPVSSSRIRSLIELGEMETANRLLGRCFTIDFQVVQGNRIGRTLGTPTINQPFPDEFVIPKFGVYATLGLVDGRWYSGVTNVGVKPTIAGSYSPLAETYLQGFSGDLYGREVEVGFLHFIRPERKFDSLEELRAQILRDADTAAEIARPHLAAEPAWVRQFD